MGTFENIARKTEPALTHFELGFVWQTNGMGNLKFLVKFEEREKGSEPVIKEFYLDLPEGKITFRGNTDSKNIDKNLPWPFSGIHIDQNDGRKKFVVDCIENDLSWLISSFFFRSYKTIRFNMDPRRFFFNDKPQLSNWSELAAFMNSIDSKELELTHFHSFAPVRSKPKRTYNPVRESADPGGEDIPVLMHNLKTADKETWRSLKKSLIDFGKHSGMFSDIDVRKFGKSRGDPFQIKIEVRNSKDKFDRCRLWHKPDTPHPGGDESEKKHNLFNTATRGTSASQRTGRIGFFICSTGKNKKAKFHHRNP